MGDFVGQAVAAAEEDMGKVASAASAIQAQYSKTKSLMNAQTASGGQADQDMGDWNALAGQVLSLLGGLPAAEQAIISGVQAQAEAELKKDPGLARVD